MATAKLQSISQWSFSRFKDYRKCPALAKYKHVDKMKEPGNKAMDRGTEIHKMAEKVVFEPVRAKLPAELKLFEEEFKTVRKLPAEVKQVELKLAFDIQWKPLVDFFDKRTWVRVVYDLRYVPVPKDPSKVVVVDHKTGKLYDDHMEQLSLYALSEFHSNPATQQVQTDLWYLDEGVPKNDTYTRDQVPKLVKFWDKATKAMLNDHRFDPTPGNHCRWCHFRKSNGGPCAY
jgi:RecB family exonuclease